MPNIRSFDDEGSRKLPPVPKAGPSGATDKTVEREEKFDEEGGDQPQAKSQHEADRELSKLGITAPRDEV
jgi:hypothetical protein